LKVKSEDNKNGFAADLIIKIRERLPAGRQEANTNFLNFSLLTFNYFIEQITKKPRYIIPHLFAFFFSVCPV